MEQKKHPKADLSRKAGLFFNIGLIISLALVITAFEWRFYDDLEAVSLGDLEEETVEMLEIPIIAVPPPPPPVVVSPTIVEAPEDEIEPEEEILFEEDEPVEVVENRTDAPVLLDVPISNTPPPKEEVNDNEPFIISEVMPEPKGGYKKFYEFLKKNLNYPKTARRMMLEGKVYVQFIVEKDGSLTDIHVVKGIGGGCDEEAIRVLQKAPKWKPGLQRGRPVRVKKAIPIIFKFR